MKDVFIVKIQSTAHTFFCRKKGVRKFCYILNYNKLSESKHFNIDIQCSKWIGNTLRSCCEKYKLF